MTTCTLNRLGVFKRFTTDWTPEEEAAMRRDYQTFGAVYMSRLLKRTKGAVTAKARKMGLSRTWVLTSKID